MPTQQERKIYNKTYYKKHQTKLLENLRVKRKNKKQTKEEYANKLDPLSVTYNKKLDHEMCFINTVFDPRKTSQKKFIRIDSEHIKRLYNICTGVPITIDTFKYVSKYLTNRQHRKEMYIDYSVIRPVRYMLVKWGKQNNIPNDIVRLISTYNLEYITCIKCLDTMEFNYCNNGKQKKYISCRSCSAIQRFNSMHPTDLKHIHDLIPKY